MRHRTAPLLAAVLLAGGCPAADLTLAITADTSISAFDSERDQNAGGAPRIKLKGIENLILLLPEVAQLAGQVVEKAELRLKGCDDRLMIARIGVSTVATAWNEGAGSYAAAGAGESCFLEAAKGMRPWAGPGSVLLDAVFARGGTQWMQTPVERDAEGWYHIRFDGRLLEACAAGLSHGLALSDDNGQTMNIHADVVPATNHSNNFFFAHEQSNARPVVAVTVHPAPPAKVAALAVTVKPWAGGADLATGAVEITWPGPADEAARAAIVGYRVRLGRDGALAELPRWQHPSVPPVGEAVRALVRGQAADAALGAEVEVIGRGGAVMAAGRASGRAAPPLAAPKPLTVNHPALPGAGEPPATTAGAAWAVPDLVQVNPLTGAVREEPGVDFVTAKREAGKRPGTWSQANPAWSGATRTIQVSALRGEWAAFQVVCEATRPETTWRITPGDLAGPGGARIPASAIRLARLWYQQVGGAWHPDPLLPLAPGDAFHIPDARNAVPGQTTQTVHVEWFVPGDAAPGAYAGRIAVDTGDGPIELAVALSVGRAVIPVQTAFTWSMNAYSSPGADFGPADSADFLAAERSFYRLAHEHRTNLAVLGYSHAADFQADVAWPLTGKGADMRVADWSAWDRRYGPLFDGSAFAGTPRAGVPLDHFYLPFMESWPTPMAEGYRWNDAQWEEHWRVAGPVGEGFNATYRQQWVAVMRDFIAHVHAKKWTTTFQVYLNDKYFYKQYDGKRKKHGRGTSFWLLDEPQHTDDFLALAFFGGLIREAQGADRTVVHRVDVSRPQWGRDILDRVVDLNVSGGFSEFRPWLEDWRERDHQRIWTYGGAPPSPQGSLGIVAQALDLYSRGVDGFVPWLTIGGPANWTAFEDTCVYYSGKPFGIVGACASLRLKAYRRAEQDVSLLKLVAEREGLLAGDPDRRRVGALIAAALGGERQKGSLDAQGAVTERIGGLTVERLDALRRALATRAEGR
jgi:hypothetical protein